MKFKKLFLGGACIACMLMCTPQPILADNSAELKNIDGVVYYYENGKVNKQKKGFVKVGDITVLVGNGKVLSNANGLVQDIQKESDWYYLAEGRVQTQYTGLALYDGAWFYVENGKLDTTLADFVSYDNSLFYVGLGRVMTEVNGLAQDPDGTDWYYLAQGQVQTQYTGLAEYDGAWFYVIEGKLAKNYTGEVSYNGAQFHVENGMVVVKETGISREAANAYMEIIKRAEKEYPGAELRYELVYVTEDNVPELVVDNPCYWVSLYTFVNGEVKQIMDYQAYGTHGRTYDYIPKAGIIYSQCYSQDQNSSTYYDEIYQITDNYQFEGIKVFAVETNYESDWVQHYIYGGFYTDEQRVTEEQFSAAQKAFRLDEVQSLSFAEYTAQEMFEILQ